MLCHQDARRRQTCTFACTSERGIATASRAPANDRPPEHVRGLPRSGSRTRSCYGCHKEGKRPRHPDFRGCRHHAISAQWRARPLPEISLAEKFPINAGLRPSASREPPALTLRLLCKACWKIKPILSSEPFWRGPWQSHDKSNKTIRENPRRGILREGSLCGRDYPSVLQNFSKPMAQKQALPQGWKCYPLRVMRYRREGNEGFCGRRPPWHQLASSEAME